MAERRIEVTEELPQLKVGRVRSPEGQAGVALVFPWGRDNMKLVLSPSGARRLGRKLLSLTEEEEVQ